MAKTRTSGITTAKDGTKIVCKRVDGEQIYARLGRVSQEEAEQWLANEIARRRIARGQRAVVTFATAAARYLTENRARLRTIELDAYHIELVTPWIGWRPLEQVHDGTLEPFVRYRREVDRVSSTTIKRTLEVVRKILNLAATKWRFEDGEPWLRAAVKVTMPTIDDARKPYPLSWDEQARLFQRLPKLNAQMALFAVNTGLREQELCGLRWEWMQQVEGVGRLFVIPSDRMKNREDGVVVLNRTAESVIEERWQLRCELVQRFPRSPVDQEPEYFGDFVFFYQRGKDARPQPVKSMNNTAWQRARAAEGLPARVHDLRHTFARRLRAAGVPWWTIKTLLRHKTGDITLHYSAAELAELVEAVNKIDATRGTPAITLLRAADMRSCNVLQQSLTPRWHVA